MKKQAAKLMLLQPKTLLQPQALPFNAPVGFIYLVAVIAILVSVSYLDRPLASFLHDSKPSDFGLTPVFKLLANTPLALEVLAGVVVLIGLLTGNNGYRYLVKPIVLVAISATMVRVGAKIICGRTWPETWINNNPSWIEHGVEMFAPFSLSQSYHSFPSGHALFTFAFASLFWQYSPKLYWLWLTAMVSVFIGQLGQNYHYLGDLLAGAVLGVLISQLVSHYCLTRVSAAKVSHH
ncbi:phosphatase PAP2 family protein [Shewanella sp. UCD-KL21]|uniref:phosphatase PAP2 family protein n=1 Tax=Shewanella sp. UCD-KL21 TaxID=1917164 RepID=UPI0009712242|nr:phosphatase PAP2 family protein [Shewanella sp. UCD-KL21]